jgi:hypothetical protein
LNQERPGEALRAVLSLTLDNRAIHKAKVVV